MRGLVYGQNYTVKIFSYDRHVKPEYESVAATTWFMTPDCLTVTNNNVSLCGKYRFFVYMLCAM